MYYLLSFSAAALCKTSLSFGDELNANRDPATTSTATIGMKKWIPGIK